MAESYIVHYLSISKPLALLIVFIGMIIEGDILLFTSAFLSAQGLFHPVELFATALVGVMTGDYLWYWAGARLLPKFPWLERWVERITHPVDEHLRHRQLHTFAVSKFAYNMHHPILMRAGMLGLDKQKFIKNDFFSSLIWIAVVGGLGYFSSLSVGLFRHYIKFAEVILLAALVLFIAITHFVGKMARKGI